MSCTKFWYINCDKCSVEGGDGEGSYGFACDTLQQYRAKLRAAGWTFGARDLCMECNGNGPRERAALGVKPRGPVWRGK